MRLINLINFPFSEFKEFLEKYKEKDRTKNILSFIESKNNEYYEYEISSDDAEIQSPPSIIPNVPTNWNVTANIRIHSFSHKNGMCEVPEITWIEGYPSGVIKPKINLAARWNSVRDYGFTTRTNENGQYIRVPVFCTNNYRLRTIYDLIKSKDEWDYNYHLDNNPYKYFTNGFIHVKDSNGNYHNYTIKNSLKFYAKEAGSEEIQIAIANYWDFEMVKDGNKLYNESIAFRENKGGNIIDYKLLDLFEYAPLKNEVGIAIKRGSDIESFVVSFDPEKVDGNNRTMFIETVINEKSKYVYCLSRVNPNDITTYPITCLVQDRFGVDEFQIPKEHGVLTQPLTIKGGKSPDIKEQSLRDAYFSVEDKEKYEIDIIIGNEFLKDRSNPYSGDNQNIAIDLAETRKDCIAFIGARYIDTVGKKSGEAVNAIVDYMTETNSVARNDSVKLTRSMFAAFFGNYFRIYDKYSRKYRWINVAGDLAGIKCNITTTNASWWAAAGMKRGIIRNIDRMAISPSREQRDILYKNGVNPLVVFPGTGNLVWGNKTLLPYASAFDRINVRSMFNEIERAMAKAARSQLFEFNDAYTRNAVLAMFNPYLASIQAARGIQDYKVVCDESNNDANVISRNELVVDIYIKPTYVAEFIQLNFVNVGTRSFATVIGT